MCQCPVSGKSHFYARYMHETQKVERCVNALYRASLISTLEPKYQEPKREKMCQCPVSGKSHFYILEHRIGRMEYKHCVNALYRASLISTDFSTSC